MIGLSFYIRRSLSGAGVFVLISYEAAALYNVVLPGGKIVPKTV